MGAEVIRDDVSIVLLGSFNPRLFHPQWLAANGMISSDQADAAALSPTVVTNEFTQFTAAYMLFDVQSPRFLVRCETLYKEVVRDLVLKAFGEYLPHVPIWRLGLNRSFEFRCGSEQARDKLGQLLAPSTAWGDWGKSIKQGIDASVPNHGGVTRVTMMQRPRVDGYDGFVQADVQPSGTHSDGVTLDINSDYALGDPATTMGSAKALDIVATQWDASFSNAQAIANSLMGATNGEH